MSDAYPWRDKELLERLYVDEELSTVQIAERLDTGSTTINNWLDRHEIEVRSVAESVSNHYEKKNKSERETAVELYKSGNSPIAVAKELDRPEMTVRTWLYNADAIKKNVECPTCGDWFANENGMKVHHTKSHGESISGVEVKCDYCGSQTRTHRKYIRQLDHHFCDGECAGAYQSENRVGENHPSYNRIEIECDHCNDVTTTTPCHLENHKRHFCGQDCHHAFLRENGEKLYGGENSPVWKGGYGHYYGANWLKQRKAARERDGYVCQSCGVDESDLEKELAVHHIKRVGWFRDNYDDPEWWQKANKLENLVSLCNSCHQRWEGIPLRPYLAN